MLINFYSVDSEQNRYRYFTISDLQLDFFSDKTVDLIWGRLGCAGQRKTLLFNNKKELYSKVNQLVDLRKSHGYEMDIPSEKVLNIKGMVYDK